MEGISVTAYKKMKHYLRRQGYRRIDGPKIRRAKLGGGGGGGRRSWRIKIKPKLKFLNKVGSPKKLFIWLRDAYVRMMVGFANSAGGGMVGVGCGAGYGGAIGDGGGFGRKVVKEYDEKMIIEIYKSLVIAQTRRREGGAGAADESGVAQKLAAIVE